MFGFSFSEIVLIGVVTLVAVGPKRLPGMLRNFGQWMRKIRKMTTEVRQQTGIDEMLRAEGLHGGITELRSLMRGGGGFAIPAPAPAPAPTTFRPADDPYSKIDMDVSREYPPEGPDALGALPDDLTTEDDRAPAVETSPVAVGDVPAAPAVETKPVIAVGEVPAAPAVETKPVAVGEVPAAPAVETSPVAVGEIPAAPAADKPPAP